MDDIKTQESKKTVVAFVAGLIIGGLLVWTFSGAPEAGAPGKTSDDETTTTSQKYTDETVADKTEDTTMLKEPTTNNFTFTVADQPAGMFVELGDNVKYPTKEGWIAVHEDVNEEIGSVLGAARYDTVVGLMPDQIELLRNTEAGKKYHVVYYIESGDRKFDRHEDTPITAESGGLVETTFVAE
jgi:hypothetical protein